ncbi:hypothetical protein [Halonotius roseus]|uniref:Uncharacterized protein n=1 Tax=Halonotius roseus TaxID=2511997 RepID=A0A544QS94_9EURY|nr:hypothetical protein [Halonotius roseus]TQQ82296.1 hypothetical protein EWF95_05045 [Halonotius roseus]
MDRLPIGSIRSVSVRYSAVVFFLAGGLFLATIFIEVTIIVESPAIGDVSDVFRLVIQAISAVVGLTSGLITIYEYVTSEDSPSQGPVDELTIEGDFHLHLGDPEFTRSDSPTDESDEESSRSPDDE